MALNKYTFEINGVKVEDVWADSEEQAKAYLAIREGINDDTTIVQTNECKLIDVQNKVTKLIHIGYYNNVDDLHYLATENADNIVEYQYSCNNFHKIDGIVEYNITDFPENSIQFTKDNRFAVVKNLPIDLSLIDDIWDYIDVYEVVITNL